MNLKLYGGAGIVMQVRIYDNDYNVLAYFVAKVHCVFNDVILFSIEILLTLQGHERRHLSNRICLYSYSSSQS
jgi:hypothetical protein